MVSTKIDTVEFLLGDSIENLYERYGSSRVIASLAEQESASRGMKFSISPRLIRMRRGSARPPVRLPRAFPQSTKATATEEGRELYNEVSTIINNLSEIDPLPSVDEPATSPGGEDIVCLISDWHVGKVVEREGRRLYDVHIASRRIDEFIQQLRHLLDNYILTEHHEIDNLHLCLLGDIVDCEITYETQAHHIDMPVLQQIEFAEKGIMRLLKTMQPKFKNIIIHTVPGNHGEMDGMHYSSNWDNVLYLMCQRATKDMKIPWDISMDRHNNITVKDQRIHLRHGRELPKQCTTAAGRAKVGGWIGLHGDFDAMCLGHWHTAKMDSFNGRPIFFNGSLVGGDDLSERMAMTDPPRQIVFGVTEKRIPTFLFMTDLG